MTSSKYLTSEENAGVNQIRSILRNKLPEDLNTDLYLARWWRYWEGDITEIESHLSAYLDNRKACHCDRENFIENALNCEMYDGMNITFPYGLPISKLDDAIDKKTNCVVFVERGMAQGKQWSKHWRCYDYVFSYFVYCEYIQQLILRQEKRTGRPASSTVIFDMEHLVISDWFNVFSPHFKILLLRNRLWEKYFPELVQKIIVVNQPRIMGILWRLAKLLLSESHQKALYFISDYAQIWDHLDSSVIPACYGGNLKDMSGFGDPETCCRNEVYVSDDAIYHAGTVWKNIKLENIPGPKLIIIKPHKSFTLEYYVSKPDIKMIWQFWINGEVEFGVTRIDDDTKSTNLVWPRLPLVANKLPEERIFNCEKVGTYLLEFNNEGFFNLKLEYIVYLV